jgi:ectoine hydroxylase-related dioxygenase (phytanoyl-CoA dioxygenase family)
MAHATLETLTFEQDAQFERDGYLILRSFYTRRQIDEIREAFMAQSADGPVAGLSEFRKDFGPDDPLSRYPRMLHPHAHPELAVGRLAKLYLLDPRLYPILKALMAEEPVAAQSMFYFKPPGARGQELHQDNLYLRVTPGTCMAAWIAIDDVDAENGGMRVVPGSHRMDIICPEKADLAKSFSDHYVPVPDGLTPVRADMEAGDVLFFNGSLIHGSTPNTSATRFRRSLIFHYVPRFSQELANFYINPTTFDGEVLSIPAAVGGGPCGMALLDAPH